MNFKKELVENQAVLAVVKGMSYNDVLAKNFKFFSGKKVCYVSFNKTCLALKDWLEKNGVDVSDFIFIDAVSRNILTRPVKKSCCRFLSSPYALTELSMLIDQLLKRRDFEFLVVDSVNNMLVYEPAEFVKKFLLRVVNKIKETNVRAVVCALFSDERVSFIQEVSLFFDKIVELK